MTTDRGGPKSLNPILRTASIGTRFFWQHRLNLLADNKLKQFLLTNRQKPAGTWGGGG